jgi:hypothetical protein
MEAGDPAPPRAQRLFRRSPVLVPAAIVAATLLTWIVTVDRMQGMDAWAPRRITCRALDFGA